MIHFQCKRHMSSYEAMGTRVRVRLRVRLSVRLRPRVIEHVDEHDIVKIFAWKH